jgi:hypothetical protein
MRRPDNNIRTVDALAGTGGSGTHGIFRALSEADDFVHAREQRDEAHVRLDELEAENRELKAENAALKRRLVGRRNGW